MQARACLPRYCSRLRLLLPTLSVLPRPTIMRGVPFCMIVMSGALT